MSLVDPLTRWWNRRGVRRAAAWVCWVLAGIFAVAGAAASAIEVDQESTVAVPGWVIPVSFAALLPLLLGGIFLSFIGSESEDTNMRVLVYPLAGLFVVLGAVPVVYSLITGARLDATWPIFAALGLVAIIVAEIVMRRMVGNQRIRTAVQRTGVRTTGVVTRATGYDANYRRVTKVTVRFTDADGRERWSSATLGGRVVVGERVDVRYLPDALDRRAAVTISAR